MAYQIILLCFRSLLQADLCHRGKRLHAQSHVHFQTKSLHYSAIFEIEVSQPSLSDARLLTSTPWNLMR